MKEMWWTAQNDANLSEIQRKAIQDSAHARAEQLRAELAKLEKGNETVEKLVKQSGDDAGTWEGYKLSKIEEKIKSKSEAIYEEQRNEARAIEERNWFQKALGISNYDSRYEEFDKVTLQELNKLYELQAEYLMAVELGRNVFEKEIELDEDAFKIKPQEGQILKQEYDIREMQLNVLNGFYFERYKKGINRNLEQEHEVFDYYNYEHYKDTRYEMFGSTDEGTWADYLNKRGPIVDMAFISAASITWKEAGEVLVKGIELSIATYMTVVMATDMISQAVQTFNYYASVFNSQGYYAAVPVFDINVSASGQAVLGGSRTISLRLPYVGTLGAEAALSNTINFATFSDPAMEADVVGGGSGGMDPFDEGTGNSVNVLGRGSTGRTVANNLNEQLAMKEVMSNPLENATTVPLKNGMTDSRWLGTDGWTKMQRVITTSDGKNITIHFNYNEITGAFDDFKFK